MSLTQPPPHDPADDVEARPSRRFRLLFGAVMLLIAFGYMWVWQVKTERVVAEAPPVLALAGATSTVPGVEPAILAQDIVAELKRIPALNVISADSSRAAGAGAQQLLYAGLSTADRVFHLEMRRLDIAGDSLIHTYRVRGASPGEAVYRMAVQIAMSFGLPRPEPAPDSTRNRLH